METKTSTQEPAFAKFVKPTYHGNHRRFRLTELRNYEAAVAGEPAPDPLPPQEERFLTAAQVRERYGGVSDMWLYRRLRKNQEV